MWDLRSDGFCVGFVFVICVFCVGFKEFCVDEFEEYWVYVGFEECIVCVGFDGCEGL